jgi:type IV pilus assembly protein PilY1
LLQGTLIVLSNVPDNSACKPGGFSYLNFFDYKSGSYVPGSTYAGVYIDSFGVGVNVVNIDGKQVAIVTTSKKEYLGFDPPISSSNPTGRRSSWRELTE